MKENKLVTYSIVFIAVVVLAIVFQTFQQVLRPLAIAILLFFLASPVARFSESKKIPSWITFLSIIIVAVFVLSFIGSLIKVDNVNLKEALPRYQQRLSEDSSGIVSLLSKFGYSPEEFTAEKVGKILGGVAKQALEATRTIFSETLMALIFLMFIAQSYTVFFKNVEKKHGKQEVERLNNTFKRIETDIVAYFGTKILMSLGTAIGTGIALFLFKTQFIGISLLMVFLLNFIPIIGSLFAVLIIILLYVMTAGLSSTVGWFFLLLMAVQVFFGSILEPKMAGDKLKMSPLLIILSLYVWGWIWGIVGMLLSVPLTILVMIIIRHVKQMEQAA